MRKILPFLMLLVALFSVFGYGCDKKTERTTYEITCELTGNLLTGTETVVFYNFTDNAFSELKFNLFGNAFRKDAAFSPVSRQYAAKAYPHGASYGEMSVSAVRGKTSERGKDAFTELEFEICGQDLNVLSVKLPTEIFPRETVAITIDFSLTLADVIARTGVNDSAINLANFYPVLCGIENGAFYECVYYANGDPFFSDCADYRVTLSASADYVTAATGAVVSSELKKDKRVNVYKAENVRSFAFVLSKDFEAITDSSAGTEITYYYYKDENPAKSLKTAVEAVKFFSESFGKYPYPTFSVVQTKFIQGGMEFPRIVFISDELDDKAYAEVIVHETAHQWWQSVVGNNEVKYGFLDEGLAEYSVVNFYEKHPDYGYSRETLVKSAEQTYKIFCSVYDKLFGKVNTAMLRDLSEFNSEYEYVNVAYVKPTIMYDCLRATLGDARFFKGLRRYYEDFAFKNAAPADLVASFNKVGADTEGFFEGFFNGKAII